MEQGDEKWRMQEGGARRSGRGNGEKIREKEIVERIEEQGGAE